MHVPASLAEFVSRETLERLEAYVVLVAKWNKTINLVAKSQVDEIWERHIWDSAQIWPLTQGVDRHVDLGSGGGFPGIVLASMSVGHGQSTKFTLIESDMRKSVFLRTVARELSLPVMVADRRFEMMPPQNAGRLTARAVAPLTNLLDAATRHLAPDGLAVLPKGANWRAEVEEARQTWSFDLETHPSLTSPDAAVLVVKEIQRV
ncbi:MAG: 16S rRNA (guanine(527)-N(7))-methyltransferase RsmG [Pseudomonadota bacterium]